MFLFFPIYLMMRCLESLKAFSNFKSPFGNHVYTEWSFWKRKKNIKDFLNMVLCLRFSIRKISIRISPFLSLVPYSFTFAHLAWPRFSPKKIHLKITLKSPLSPASSIFAPSVRQARPASWLSSNWGLTKLMGFDYPCDNDFQKHCPFT